MTFASRPAVFDIQYPASYYVSKEFATKSGELEYKKQLAIIRQILVDNDVHDA